MFLLVRDHTYSGHENKVKTNLEHRIVSMNQQPAFRRVVVPTEQVIETKDGQKVQTEKRVLPGYVLVNMSMSDEAWTVVKGTPGCHGQALHEARSAAGGRPDTPPRSARRRAGSEGAGRVLARRVREGDSGPLSDFDGEIVDVNPDQQKLKVLVDIFERQVPVELSFDQVKKID